MRTQRTMIYACALMTLVAAVFSASAQTPLPTKWTATATSGKQRHGTYTRLKNGTVIAAGSPGIELDTATARSVEIYNPATGTWTDAEPMNYARSSHDALLLPDGRLLVIGGVKGGFSPAMSYAGPPEIYDPSTGHWTVVATTGDDLAPRYNILPQPVHVLLPDGRVLGLGRLGFGAFAFFFDPRTGAVRLSNGFRKDGVPMQGGSNDKAALLFNGKVLLPLGKYAALFDPETETWQEVAQPLNSGVELASRVGALLPDGDVFSLFSTLPSQANPNYTIFSGRFAAGSLTWSNFVQRGIGNNGLNNFASVLLTNGEVLTVEGSTASLYDAKTGEGRSSTPQGNVFSPTLLADGRVLSGDQLFGVDFGADITPTFTHTSSASFGVEPLAKDSLVSVFGANLPSVNAISIRDSTNLTFKFSPIARTSDQVNYLLPGFLAEGQAVVTIGDRKGLIAITSVAPGIFTANSDGRGVPAAVLLRVKADGTQVYEAISQFDQSAGRFVSLSIDLGPEGEQVYLILFGTGWRHRSAPENTLAYIGGAKATVQYVGAQGSFDGLDQMNILLPRSVAGKGKVDLLVTIDGKAANPIDIAVR